MIERSLSFSGPASPGQTLAPQRRGPGDPCFQIDGDGAVWRTSLQTTGPVPARISRTAGSLDPRTRTLFIEIDLDNKDNFLVPGSFVQVVLKRPDLTADGPLRHTEFG